MSYHAPRTKTYLFQTLDPLHVGTGGTRLGRVDNTVVRDPATRIPKVPGSGISGAVKDAYDLCTLVDASAGRILRDNRCAGTRGCGRDACPVCVLFGTAPGDDAETDTGGGDRKARRGLLAFRDARLVAVPMASLTGPVWAMTEDFARRLGLISGSPNGLPEPRVGAPAGLAVLAGKVNVGPFLFETDAAVTFTEATDESLQARLRYLQQNPDEAAGLRAAFLNILKRVVVFSDTVLPILADAAMEVRTSVAIDPLTGAAEDKKLFTLEAVPAGAVFETDLDFLGGQLRAGFNNSDMVFQHIEQFGFPYLAVTGLGGNVTRGFGRTRFLAHWN